MVPLWRHVGAGGAGTLTLLATALPSSRGAAPRDVGDYSRRRPTPTIRPPAPTVWPAPPPACCGQGRSCRAGGPALGCCGGRRNGLGGSAAGQASCCSVGVLHVTGLGLARTPPHLQLRCSSSIDDSSSSSSCSSSDMPLNTSCGSVGQAGNGRRGHGAFAGRCSKQSAPQPAAGPPHCLAPPGALPRLLRVAGRCPARGAADDVQGGGRRIDCAEGGPGGGRRVGCARLPAAQAAASQRPGHGRIAPPAHPWAPKSTRRS